MNVITIDGVNIPHPSSLKVSMQDLDSPDTTRNEVGVLQRDRVRSNVYKIELAFTTIKGSDVQLIESSILNSKLTVTFPDTSGRITRQMYVGDRSKEVVLYNDGDPNRMRWNLNFNLIEY